MTFQGHNFRSALATACTLAALAGIVPAAAAAASTPTATTAPATTTTAPATTTQAPATTTPASGAQPGTVAPGATPTTTTPTTSVPATTTPPTATTPTATTPATPTPATTTPSGATSPGSPTTVVGVSRKTPQSTRLSAGTLALAILGALLALGCLVWVVGRWLALEPRWSVSMMHSLREASYHASATWAEFSDWARLGR